MGKWNWKYFEKPDPPPFKNWKEGDRGFRPNRNIMDDVTPLGKCILI